jgi:hypothetical protein
MNIGMLEKDERSWLIEHHRSYQPGRLLSCFPVSHPAFADRIFKPSRLPTAADATKPALQAQSRDFSPAPDLTSLGARSSVILFGLLSCV